MAKLSQQGSQKSSSKNSSGASTSNDSSSSAATKVKKRTRKSVPRDSPPRRSSVYRGVTRHRWTGRYEAHLWDKNCWNESQNKKGRQVYLGAYDEEAAAAHAYDLAALKYWGQDTVLNFPLSTYEEQIKEMEGQSKEEYIGSLRRKSSGFARGVSKYRGVARHHHNGRWEARIGRVFGNKYLYLGTYATQEEAAVAYDMAAIEYRGLNAITNFDLSRYIKWLKPSQTSGANSQPNPNLSPSPDADPNPDLNSAYTADHELSLSPSSTTLPPPRATASSALGLLLQSSKFKEMLERTAATDCLSTPSESDPPRRSFPDDIQTYFDGHDSGSSFGDGDDDIFADLNSFATPMFQCELDAC
ncbi:AP2-like ethylene-responsive transcription factor At1g16060 [Diospyros lotus]|uniref:AP2-like ethylene-responsive transcription factor At1g16060 n=1 Tax=Diospyros lotus TaxID=55363 RepID=UPI00225724E5|nr:AP2-like ethylene-responsive transcription factor At1g16060 [Diospyros lotus]